MFWKWLHYRVSKIKDFTDLVGIGDIYYGNSTISNDLQYLGNRGV